MRNTMFALPALLLVACADTPTYQVPNDSPSNPIAFSVLNVDGAPAAIATGGVQVVSIPDLMSVGWSGKASSGFDVEPYGDVWPNTRKPEYRVRALGQGAGSFSIQTEHGIASGDVASAEVDHVSATLVSPGVIEVSLYDHDGHRLIDGSLAVRDDSDPSATQTGWDQLSIAATHGTHTLTISADSFAAQQLTVSVE